MFPLLWLSLGPSLHSLHIGSTELLSLLSSDHGLLSHCPHDSCLLSLNSASSNHGSTAGIYKPSSPGPVKRTYRVRERVWSPVVRGQRSLWSRGWPPPQYANPGRLSQLSELQRWVNQHGPKTFRALRNSGRISRARHWDAPSPASGSALEGELPDDGSESPGSHQEVVLHGVTGLLVCPRLPKPHSMWPVGNYQLPIDQRAKKTW